MHKWPMSGGGQPTIIAIPIQVGGLVVEYGPNLITKSIAAIKVDQLSATPVFRRLHLECGARREMNILNVQHQCKLQRRKDSSFLTKPWNTPARRTAQGGAVLAEVIRGAEELIQTLKKGSFLVLKFLACHP